MMVVTHFLENRQVVLTQLLKQLPSVNDNIKIKGKKGKVLKVYHVNEKTAHVEVLFEQIAKKNTPVMENKKKKR